MANAAWSWSLQKEIPSSLDAGHRLIEQLIAALESHGWEGRDLFHVQLAVEEAMVNAITHGNKQADDKVVEVEFKVEPQATMLRIKDQGEGFNPADVPDPRDDDHLECTNGRGVMLIREMMSEVHYNERGNQVTMVKRRVLEGK
jgi:serine/threonine-protein kinase RsbW